VGAVAWAARAVGHDDGLSFTGLGPLSSRTYSTVYLFPSSMYNRLLVSVCTGVSGHLGLTTLSTVSLLTVVGITASR